MVSKYFLSKFYDHIYHKYWFSFLGYFPFQFYPCMDLFYQVKSNKVGSVSTK